MEIREILDAWFDGRKAKGMKTPPPAVIYELWYVLNDLECHGVSETINNEVKDIVEKHGFRIVEKGVGWEVFAK